MYSLPLRLHPASDLRREIEKAVAALPGGSGFVLSGVGSLSQASLKFAAVDAATLLVEPLEILTLAGSVGASGAHLHASVATASGRVLGGHLGYGSLVRTTAEVLVAVLPEWRLTREHDPATGFAELVVAPGRRLADAAGAAQPEPLPRAAERIVLRRLRPADLAAFQAYRNDETAGRYQGWSRHTDAEACGFIAAMSAALVFPRGEWVQLAVADRESDELLGDMGVCVAADGRSAELGFTIAQRFQGRGLGAEALRAAIGLVFERSPVREVVCITDARNNPCIRLLERAGMQRTATAEAVFRGEPCIEHTYRTLRPAEAAA